MCTTCMFKFIWWGYFTSSIKINPCGMNAAEVVFYTKKVGWLLELLYYERKRQKRNSPRLSIKKCVMWDSINKWGDEWKFPL